MVRRRWWILLGFGVLLPLLGIVAIVAGSGGEPGAISARTANDQLAAFLATNSRLADEHIDEFCALAAKLEARPVFQKPTRTKDASAFMAERLGWDAPDAGRASLSLPEDVKQRLLAYETEWPAKISDADLAGLDFGWMHDALEFDHWSLATDARPRESPRRPLYAQTMPDFLLPQLWAKLRLAAALKSGEFMPATEEVRHLAHLIHTQDTLISEMVSFAILRQDQTARAAAAAREIDVSTWPALTDAELTAARRVAWGLFGYSAPGVRAETLRRASECAASTCGGLVEGLVMHYTFSGYTSVSQAAIAELAKSHGCDPRLIEVIRETPRSTPKDIVDAVAGGTVPLKHFLSQ